jgi:phosphomannomutase
MLATDIGCLKALPTRDAVIAILSVLMLSVSENKTILTLVSELPPRYTESSKIDDFPNSLSTDILESIKCVSSADIQQIIIEYYRDEVSITDINTVDGVRITLSNHDIMHFRASGNAPEFRVYSESDSYESSKVMNDFCNQYFSEFLD